MVLDKVDSIFHSRQRIIAVILSQNSNRLGVNASRGIYHFKVGHGAAVKLDPQPS